MLKNGFALLLITLTLMLSGCSGGGSILVKISPESIKDNGLLTAKLSSSKLSLSHTRFAYAHAIIDNTFYTGAINNGYLVVPLKPGVYTLDAIRVSQYNTYTTYSMGINFEVKANRITNLGLMLMYHQPGVSGYRVFNIDNQADILGYLNARHPLAYKRFKEQPILPPTKGFLDKTSVKSLRYKMIIDKTGKRITPGFITTPAGTMAELVLTRDNKIDIKLLDTRSFNEFKTCQKNTKHLLCLGLTSTYQPALYFYNGHSLKTIAIPDNTQKYDVYLSEQSQIVLSDGQFNLYSLNADAKTWTRHAEMSHQDSGSGHPRHNYVSGLNGVYILDRSAEGKKHIAAHLSRKGKLSQYALPEDNYSINALDTHKELHSGPHKQGEQSIVFSYDFKAKNWYQRKIPAANCGALQVINLSKNQIGVSCKASIDKKNDNAPRLYVAAPRQAFRLANQQEILADQKRKQQYLKP